MDNSTDDRLAIIEKRLARIEKLLNIPEFASLDDIDSQARLRAAVVYEYKTTNSFISALKKHRELTGSTLMIAKNYIDTLREQGAFD